MAGPKNNFNSLNKIVTVYGPDGVPFETTRPNAIDLVRTNNYRWKQEDVGKAHIEDDGPIDPSADVVVIYTPNGDAVEVNRANARELVATGYTWYGKGEAKTEAEAAEAVVVAAAAVAATEAKIAAEDENLAESLTEEAVRVMGTDDLPKYLEGFSLEALKQLAAERYGEKIHHRASKETAVAKIAELEEGAQTT